MNKLKHILKVNLSYISITLYRFSTKTMDYLKIKIAIRLTALILAKHQAIS